MRHIETNFVTTRECQRMHSFPKPRSKICTEVLWKILDLGFARTSLSLYQSKILARSLVGILDLGFEQECILNAFLPKLLNMPEFL